METKAKVEELHNQTLGYPPYLNTRHVWRRWSKGKGTQSAMACITFATPERKTQIYIYECHSEIIVYLSTYNIDVGEGAKACT